MSERDVRQADVEDVRSPLWEEAVAAGAARGAVAPASPGADDAGDDGATAAGSLRRYARWQWRDFWRRRGGWLALGALLGVWLLTYLAAHGGAIYGPPDAQGRSHLVGYGPMRPDQLAGMAHAFFALGGALAALLGVGGLVSRERERGLQRFLFAKPVRPVRYYLQALAVNSAGALLVVLGAVLLATTLLGAVIPAGTVLGVAAGAYLLTAGVTFFVSTLLPFDAPFAAAWLFGGFAMISAADHHWPGARLLSWLFPQGPAFELLRRLAAGQHPEHVVRFGALVVLIAVLYGLLALAGGVAVLRRRAIST